MYIIHPCSFSGFTTHCSEIGSFAITSYLSRIAQLPLCFLHFVIWDCVIGNANVLTHTWILECYISFPYFVISICSTGLQHLLNGHYKIPDKCGRCVCPSVTDALSTCLTSLLPYLFI